MSAVVPSWLVDNIHGANVAAPGIAGGLLALVNVALLLLALGRKPRSSGEGKVSDAMVRIADTIQEGAKSFLRTEYTYLTMFVFVVFIVLFVIFGSSDLTDPARDNTWLSGLIYACCFLVGAILSASAGWCGMIVATDANVKTAYAAESKGMNEALQVAFAGGSVMGFTVVGLGLLGLSSMFCLVNLGSSEATEFDLYKQSFKYMAGFGFGASSIALFARVAGGIYTKAADVGADLVGKVEEDLPEDDPRNPAVIADNVGDNVGDVAGMGADLFESYVGSIIAAGTLASTVAEQAFPFYIAGLGIFASLIGSKMVCTKEGASQESLLRSMFIGLIAASIFSLGLSAVFVYILELDWNLYGCMVIGLIAGVFIGEATERATSYAFAPTKSIALAGKTGEATVIIQGLGVGMLSTFPPVLIIVVCIMACDVLGGGYGIAIAAVGMLSTLGVSLATDAYGPVADNAGGIAEMSGQPESVRDITDALDALGNTTAATGKGFAIGSAVLTSLSLLSSFKIAVFKGDESIDLDITSPVVLGGCIFGAMLPYLFAALTMLSVRRAATSIILEVRRQFRTNPALKDLSRDDVLPDYKACIDISTKSSVEEMILPGVLAILMPVTIGILVGPKCLLGMLAGSIASGCMLAIMMSNAGGAWDNAKKYIEIELKEKGTDVHKACVVGDTVGDPFKDTSGPALNILIKLMSMVSLVMAPLLDPVDYATSVWGIIPLAAMILITIVVYCKFWAGYEDAVEAKMKEYDAMGVDTPAPKTAEPEAVELIAK